MKCKEEPTGSFFVVFFLVIMIAFIYMYNLQTPHFVVYLNTGTRFLCSLFVDTDIGMKSVLIIYFYRQGDT